MSTTSDTQQVGRSGRRAGRVLMVGLAVLIAAGVAAFTGYLVTRGDSAGAPAPPAVIVVHGSQPVSTLVRPRPLRVPLATEPARPPRARAAAIAPLAPPVAVRPYPPQRSPSDETYVGPAI